MPNVGIAEGPLLDSQGVRLALMDDPRNYLKAPAKLLAVCAMTLAHLASTAIGQSSLEKVRRSIQSKEPVEKSPSDSSEVPQEENLAIPSSPESYDCPTRCDHYSQKGMRFYNSGNVWAQGEYLMFWTKSADFQSSPVRACLTNQAYDPCSVATQSTWDCIQEPDLLSVFGIARVKS